MPPTTTSLPRTRDTYALAHTARCKLRLAADRPDRDLRFILGHAFTLDKVLLRVVEIERNGGGEYSDDDDDDENRPTCTSTSTSDRMGKATGKREKRISFTNGNRPEKASLTRPKSPPPIVGVKGEEEEFNGSDGDSDSGSDSSEDDDVYDDYEESEGLGLQRFASASGRPARTLDDGVEEAVELPSMVQDDGVEEDVNEPKSPTEEECLEAMKGVENVELGKAYTKIKGCPCHGNTEVVPKVEKMWEIPGTEGIDRRQFAVVQVAA